MFQPVSDHTNTMRHPENQPSSKASPNANNNHLPEWKRVIDIGCCVVFLPLLGILTLIMTVLTRLLSPGPVLFRQERVGLNGRRFMIYKFRTMHVGSDTRGHQSYVKELIGSNAPMAKLDSRGDSRLIPGSLLLRASGMDELPQVINVLRGEMSLVGPRPCLPGEYVEYQPWQRRRCEAVPGLTGLWQVSGKNRTTFEEMVRLDIRYAEHKSWWLDTKIIFLTVPALLVQMYDSRFTKKAVVAAAPIPAFALNNGSTDVRNAESTRNAA
jgi:lipopolysaccharide/colanic/teichoic acid biosynthesis glycosyltransferase